MSVNMYIDVCKVYIFNGLHVISDISVKTLMLCSVKGLILRNIILNNSAEALFFMSIASLRSF